MRKLFDLLLHKIGIIGAFAYSAANFVVAFSLQTTVKPEIFGLYALAIVFLQFGLSLSNALFASPIVVALTRRQHPSAAVISSYFAANTLFCIVGVAIMLSMLHLLGADGVFILLMGIQTFLLWMRWFFRAVELAEHNFTRPAVADILFSVVVIALACVLFLIGGITLNLALVAMATGACASFLFIGSANLAHVLGALRADMSIYWNSFMEHGRWATLGVVTTELTANVHSYLIGIFIGPAAFAPVATLSLFYRPIPILMQAITQYERPTLARLHHEGKTLRIAEAVRGIHWVLIGAVAGNSVLVAGLILLAPRLIGDGRYSYALLWPLMLLLGLTHVVRALRTGSSAALQGAGWYKPLAYVTVIAAPVSVVIAVACLPLGAQAVVPILVAVLMGEIVSAVLIERTFRKMLSEGGKGSSRAT